MSIVESPMLHLSITLRRLSLVEPQFGCCTLIRWHRVQSVDVAGGQGFTSKNADLLKAETQPGTVSEGSAMSIGMAVY